MKIYRLLYTLFVMDWRPVAHWPLGYAPEPPVTLNSVKWWLTENRWMVCKRKHSITFSVLKMNGMCDCEDLYVQLSHLCCILCKLFSARFWLHFTVVLPSGTVYILAFQLSAHQHLHPAQVEFLSCRCG